MTPLTMGGTVFIKLGALGDMVQCLPALKALKEDRPEAPLTVVTMKWSASLLRLCPWIDEVVAAPGLGEGRIWAWGPMVLRLRAQKPDRVFVAHRNRSAMKVAWLMGGKERIGFDYRGQAWGLTRTVPYREDQHEADRYVSLAEAAGVSVGDREPSLEIPEVLREEAGRRFGFRPDWNYLFVHPGGGKNPGTDMPIKRWGPDRWAAFCDRFVHERDLHLVLVGGPAERALADDVVRRMDQPSVINLAGRVSVAEEAALYTFGTLFVGGDSGPLHIAAAVGVPTVGVFGPTDPAVFGVRGSRHRVVWHRVPCAPCYTPRAVWEGLDFSVCPIGTHECMKGLEVDEVWRVVKEML